MAMFPIFLIGVLVGGIVGYATATVQKNSPSEVSINLLQDEIAGLKNDNLLLEKIIQKKDKAIKQLKDDISILEDKMIK